MTNFYTDILRTTNPNQFLIINRKDKPKGGALSVLGRIEEVMSKGMEYVQCENENTSQRLDQDAAYEILREKAEAIRDGYMKKTSSLSLLRRFFGKVSKKEEKVSKKEEVIQGIVNRIVPQPFLPLPNETIRKRLNEPSFLL